MERLSFDEVSNFIRKYIKLNAFFDFDEVLTMFYESLGISLSQVNTWISDLENKILAENNIIETFNKEGVLYSGNINGEPFELQVSLDEEMEQPRWTMITEMFDEFEIMCRLFREYIIPAAGRDYVEID